MVRLALATRVVVLRHRKEVHKPTNTGRLAPLTLSNSELRGFGGRDVAFDARGLIDPERRTLLLFPGPGAAVLTRDDHDERPVTLLVPDADWRRAYKLAQHEPALRGIAQACLPSGPPSSFRLRRHTDPRFLATFESIARALGILEGPGVENQLARVFERMVAAHLASRGRLAPDEAR